MNKFKTLLFLAAFSGIGLWGCDDSSSATEDNNETSAVESSSSTNVNKDKSSESKTEDEISSGEDQSVNDGKTQSSDNRGGLNKTSSSSKGNNGGLLSSSSVGGVGLCSYGTCDVEDEIVRISGYGITNFICKNGCYEEIVVESSSSSSSKYPVMDSVFNSELSYGKFEDPRDHQVYKTKKGTLPGGEQEIEVFAQNLNFGKWVKSTDIVADDDTVKYCYDDDEWYCKNYFGGLYSWAETMGFPDACNYHVLNTAECPFTLNGRDYTRQHRGICPEGWHITNKEEWVAIVGEGKTWSVISKVHGEDNYTGTSVLFSGSSGAYGKHYDGFGHMAAYHLPAVLDGNGVEKDSLHPVVAFHDFDYNRSFNSYTYNPSSRKYQNFSVRCTKDYIYKE